MAASERDGGPGGPCTYRSHRGRVPGSQFNGAILPELERLVHADIITVIDGLVVTKDDNGDVVLVELSEAEGDSDAARLARVIDRVEGLISDEDVAELTADLAPGSTAAILAFEHTWMKPLRDAVVGSGGVLLADVQIPGAVVEELLATIPDED